MNHVLDLANGNSGGGDSESPDEISLLAGSDSIPELGLTKEFLDTYEADLLAMADVVTYGLFSSLRKSSKRPFILAVSCAMGRRAMPL